MSAIVLFLVGCEGFISAPGATDTGGGGGGGGTPIPPPVTGGPDCPECGPGAPVATTAYLRLSHAQWEHSVRDLFGWTSDPNLSDSFAADPHTIFASNPKVLEVTPNHWLDYQKAAEAVATRVTSDAAALARIRASDGSNTSSIYTRFLTKAFRRPLQDGELSRYLALHEEGVRIDAAADDFQAGLRLVLEAVLQSPSFLYRDEDGPVQTDRVRLTGPQLASRISYALWDSPPDDELMRSAVAGELDADEGIRTQVTRMLADERADEKIRDFHRLVLEVEELRPVHTNGDMALLESMAAESEHFVDDVILDNNGGIDELLTARHSFVNGRLAELYGLTGISGDAFVRVELDPTQRAGFLTQPGFLARNGGQTAPVHRGVFIGERVVCAPLAVPDAFPPPVFSGTTRREQVVSVTEVPGCRSCHESIINPPGFALENFDDLGRWRTVDNGQAVDSAATFNVGSQSIELTGARDMAEDLSQLRQTHACYAQHWVEFAAGRPVAAGDKPVIAEMARGSQVDGWGVREQLVSMILSETFRTRGVTQ